MQHTEVAAWHGGLLRRRLRSLLRLRLRLGLWLLLLLLLLSGAVAVQL